MFKYGKLYIIVSFTLTQSSLIKNSGQNNKQIAALQKNNREKDTSLVNRLTSVMMRKVDHVRAPSRPLHVSK